MKNRPKSITIICWFLIITSLLSTISAISSYNNPEVVKMMELSEIPISFQYFLTAIGMTIVIVCSILMLMAKKVGRVIYVGWNSISIIIGLLTSPMKMMMIPGIIFFLIIIFFLFTPKANEFFRDVERD